MPFKSPQVGQRFVSPLPSPMCFEVHSLTGSVGLWLSACSDGTMRYMSMAMFEATLEPLPPMVGLRFMLRSSERPDEGPTSDAIVIGDNNREVTFWDGGGFRRVMPVDVFLSEYRRAPGAALIYEVPVTPVPDVWERLLGDD